MWKPLKRVAMAAMVVLATTACAQAAQAEPLHVVVTFSVLGDLVKQLGGDKVSVISLVPPGGDAHVYQPTPADAVSIAHADLIVVNGLGMEGWLDRLIAASGAKAPVVVASAGIKPQTMEEEGKRITDPHAWQNLANGQAYTLTIGAALAKADPANADFYRPRTEGYATGLGDLDAWVRKQIAQVPSAKRKIITSHDAFGYFAKAYGVTILAPVGLSTDSEPTAAGLGALSDQIKKEGIKALFIENMTDPRLIETLAHESGAVIGGTLYSDSLSPLDGPANNYVMMFRHNVPAMVAAMNKN
jgi:zinc/manganese transport system substrate-binding protein